MTGYGTKQLNVLNRVIKGIWAIDGERTLFRDGIRLIIVQISFAKNTWYTNYDEFNVETN